MQRRGRLRAAVLLVSVLLMLGLSALWGPELSQWDERFDKVTWSLGDQRAVERRVIVVDIDEKSIQALGPWPWPRGLQAELLESLDRAGVSLKLLDILFEGPGEGDARLAKALASPVPTVLAQLFALTPRPIVHSGLLGGALSFGNCPTASETAYGYLGTQPDLAAAARRFGHITPLVDTDGSIRQVPGLICHQGRTYAALPLAGLLAATGSAPQLIPGHSPLDPPWWFEVEGQRVPLGMKGQLRVSYQMPRSGFVSISAVDVLRGRVPQDLLRGTWALVGATAFGARDAVPTPLGRAVSGVEVHAQELSAILDERTPYVPIGAPLWPWLAGGISALLLLAVVSWLPRGVAVAMPVVAVANSLTLYALHAYLLLDQHLWLGWVTPTLFTLISATLLVSAEFGRVRFERERLYRNLASYLPEPVAREVARREPDTQVRASRHEATVLYADLRNFSAYCDGRPPEETAMVLHLFYTTASRIVAEHGGVVEQMVGDGLLAVWNGSAPCADHAHHALDAAAELWRLCAPQLPCVASRNVPPLDLGIGIETGSVLVGSFGPAARRVHAVLGEGVTVATRLQTLTGDLACPILVGAGTQAALTDSIRLRKLGDFLLPGLAAPRSVFSLPVKFAPGHLRLAFDQDQRVAG